MTAIHILGVGITAPLIVVVGALCYGFSTASKARVGAHVRGTSRRLPVLVRATVSSIQLGRRIVAKTIVETLPVVRTTGRTLCCRAWLLCVWRPASIRVIALLAGRLCRNSSNGSSAQPYGSRRHVGRQKDQVAQSVQEEVARQGPRSKPAIKEGEPCGWGGSKRAR